MPASSALPGRPRAAGRLARSPELAAALAARLTARDRWLLRMLHEHRVLTTTQITQLAFGTTRAATARMATLYQYRAVDRFRPLAPAGSAPLHFILDDAGAAVLAAEDGITPGDLGYRRDRALAIALSPRLAHTTGANGFFTTLAAAARASRGQAALDCWWSERRCAAIWGDLARPDGYGRWRDQRARHHRLLPRVRHRNRRPATADRQTRRVRRPGRPHRHRHPRAVLAPHTPARSRPAHPPGRPAAARHPRRRLRRADSRRPGRHRHPRYQPRRPGRGGLAARWRRRAAAAAGPAHRARHARPGPGSGARRRARRAARRGWPGTRLTRPRPPGTPCPAPPASCEAGDD